MQMIFLCVCILFLTLFGLGRELYQEMNIEGV